MSGFAGVGVTRGSSTGLECFENERVGLRFSSGLGAASSLLTEWTVLRGEGGMIPMVTLRLVCTDSPSGSGVCDLLVFFFDRLVVDADDGATVTTGTGGTGGGGGGGRGGGWDWGWESPGEGEREKEKERSLGCFWNLDKKPGAIVRSSLFFVYSIP